MTSPPFITFKKQLMPLSLSLTLCLVMKLCGSHCSLLSNLVLLILPISFSSIFSKIKKLIFSPNKIKLDLDIALGDDTEEGNEETSEKCSDPLANEYVVVLEHMPLMESDDLSSTSSKDEVEVTAESCYLNEHTEVVKNEDSALDGSNYSDNLESSYCSESDDESLIEIELDHQTFEEGFKQELGGILPDLLPEFSIELLFRKHGLMEFYSELTEEDNMIEIDIAMGSIKCSRFEIEA